MSFVKQLVGQTAIYGISSIVGRLLNYLLVPLYTRLFVPEVYGIVTELYTYIAFLIIILTYGMETGFFRFAGKEDNYDDVYGSTLIPLFTTSLLFIIIIFLFTSYFAGLIQYSDHPEYIRWLAIIIGIDAFTSITFAKLRFENKAFRFVIIRIINIIINIGLNLFFLIYCKHFHTQKGYEFLNYIYSENIGVGYVFISNLIASAVTLILLLPDIFRSKLRFKLNMFLEILNYSYPLIIAGLAGTINEMLDRILLKFMLPSDVNALEQIGIYGANYKIAVMMYLFVQTFRFAAEPFFFKQEKNKNAKEIYALVMKYFIIIGLLIFLGITLYINIVKHFIDSRYYSGLSIVPIILISYLFYGIIFNLSIWYKLTNRNKYGAIIFISGALITVIMNYILIPLMGFYGSAWATLICYSSMMLLSYFLSRKYYRIKYDLKSIFHYFLIAIVLYLLAFINKIYFNINIYIFNSALIVIYVAFVFYKENIFNKLKLQF